MRRVCFAILFAAAAWPAQAGPPYVTDDPEPTAPGHWEVYAFVNGSHVSGSTAGQGGLDLNYGGAPDLQLTLVLPVAYERAGGTQTGLGTVEAAAKLKVLHQDEASLKPDLAIFPRLFLPTARSRFGPQRVNLLLPVWAGKDSGPWSVFGGGGYQINPGAGNRDFWTGGVAVIRALSERLSVGAEVYHQTADEVGGRAFTGANVGVAYQFAPHWSLLASGGPGLQNRREGGKSAFYLSLKADY